MSRMHLALVGALALVTACSSASADGTLTDGMTGEALAHIRIVATHKDPTASLTCRAFEATTDEQGAFSIPKLCDGEYGIKLGDDSLWLAETDSFPAGGVQGLELKAWRAPAGSGIYRLSEGKLEPIRTSADLKKEKIKDSEEEALYPSRIPNNLPVVGPNDHLVLVGAGAVEKSVILPLIPSGPRLFGDKETDVRMEPWSYIGIRFTDDRSFERVSAEIDEGKVLTKEKAERIVKWIPGSAIPEGRYALYQPGGRSVTLVDLGSSQKPDEQQAENQ